jgi:hypothetical protein
MWFLHDLRDESMQQLLARYDVVRLGSGPSESGLRWIEYKPRNSSGSLRIWFDERLGPLPVRGQRYSDDGLLYSESELTYRLVEERKAHLVDKVVIKYFFSPTEADPDRDKWGLKRELILSDVRLLTAEEAEVAFGEFSAYGEISRTAGYSQRPKQDP